MILAPLYLAAVQDTAGFAEGLLLGLIVCGVLGFAAYAKERAARIRAQRAAAETMAAHASQAAARESDGEALQRRMAELHVAKLEAELTMMQRQLAEAPTDADRLEASKEFHELMVEKTRLEIDSLRLHVAEQRRRVEDWRNIDPG